MLQRYTVFAHGNFPSSSYALGYERPRNSMKKATNTFGDLLLPLSEYNKCAYIRLFQLAVYKSRIGDQQHAKSVHKRYKTIPVKRNPRSGKEWELNVQNKRRLFVRFIVYRLSEFVDPLALLYVVLVRTYNSLPSFEVKKGNELFGGSSTHRAIPDGPKARAALSDGIATFPLLEGDDMLPVKNMCVCV